jgi:hypothetical protein
VRLCDHDPAEIRAALPPARRPEFDVAFLAALNEAGRTFALDDLCQVVAEWAEESRPRPHMHGR